ncbi:probable G-protein coupled receptor 32 [Erinaceus europaeus]|uniref:Probable G-protein coupled receptor 32 n=1 Tax=Erinaceus europaeus TaxID=9365 RepID=A0A1S3A969_ERIEU|nr:probable G-protein coupled receptor 32 [Erinaceus europaeus]
MVLGLPANGLVLWMTAFRMARTVTTVWFFSLALADFAILLTLPNATDILIRTRWPRSALSCKLYPAFLVSAFFISISLLVLISLDRCVSVLWPVWARNHRTVRRACWLVLGVWLLALVTGTPHLIFWKMGTHKGCPYCYFSPWVPSTKEKHIAVNLVHVLASFLLPLAVISACALLICAKLRREGWVQARRPKRLLLVLVATFFTFWFPFQVTFLLHPLYQDEPRMPLYLWATISLGCFNSCLNPFLYVFIGRDFQDKFFGSLPTVLARAFGNEGFLNPPGPQESPPGDQSNLPEGTRNTSA